MLSRAIRSRIGRPVSVALLLGAIVPSLLGATPVAAANNITFLAFHGDCQFLGAGAGNQKTVKIEWRDAEGNLKTKHSVKSSSTGSFISRCEPGELIETGDVLRTQIGTAVRSFTIPKLTANVDRDADTVSGKVDTTGLDFLGIEVDTYEGGFNGAAASAHISNPAATPNSGVASYTTSTWDITPDIKGLDEVFAVWGNARGDTFIRSLSAEGMVVWSRQAFIEFVGNSGQSVSADLLTAPAGATRGTAGGRINPFGSLVSAFTDSDGDTVRIAAGNQVAADFASDSTLVVPNIVATPNKTTDRVTVDCNVTETGTTGVRVDVYSRDGVKSGSRLGFQSNAAGGTFLANFTTSPALDIVSGDKMDVYCKFASGDVVVKSFTVS